MRPSALRVRSPFFSPKPTLVVWGGLDRETEIVLVGRDRGGVAGITVLCRQDGSGSPHEWLSREELQKQTREWELESVGLGTRDICSQGRRSCHQFTMWTDCSIPLVSLPSPNTGIFFPDPKATSSFPSHLLGLTFFPP